MDGYLRIAIRVLTERYAPEILERIQPGELGCVDCGCVAPREQFAYGKGRRSEQRLNHRYCPQCGVSIDEQGLIDGDQVASLKQRRKSALVAARSA